MRRFPVSGLLALLLASLAAQGARVHGFVRDAENGEALIGANVRVLGKPVGAATNLDGFFVITGVEAGSVVLESSYQGYRSRQMDLVALEGLSELLEIELEPTTMRLEEVVVTAEKTEQELQQIRVYAGNIRLDQKQMDLSPPFIQRDVLRSFLTVPGVLPSNDFSADLNMRGSRADENLIILDGVEVYNPNHLGGLFSAFIPSAVKHADLMRSSYPAQYGGRLGAVLYASSREGNRKRLDGEINLGALATSVQLSAPSFSGKGSWLAAVRRTYVDLATRAFTSEEVPYHFTDAQFRANYDFSERNQLSITGYWGDDVFSASSLKFVFGNRAVNLNWRHVWNAHWYSRTILSFSRFRSELDFIGGKATGVYDANHLNDWSGRSLVEYHHDESLSLEAGLVAKSIDTGYENWVLGNQKWGVNIGMSELAGYLHANWRPLPVLLLEPGLRVAAYRTNELFDTPMERYLRLEPRMGAKYLLTDRLRLKLSWGLYNQGIQQFRRDGSSFSFIWVSLDDTAPPSRAIHWTGGVEYDLAVGTSLELEAYHKNMDGISEAQPLLEDRDADDPSSRGDLFHFGSGEAFGADLSLRRSKGLWTGQAGYSLGWATRQVEEFNDGEPFYASFDKRQNLNLIVQRGFVHDEPKGFPFRRWLRLFRYNESSVGLTWRYASGPRFTRPYSATWLGGAGMNAEESVIHNYGGRNAESLAAYNRVDLAWTMTHRKESGSFEFRIGMLNIFNSPNYWGIEFDYTDDPGGVPEEVLTEGIRRLPSIELTWRF